MAAITRGQHLIGKRLGSCTLESLLGHGGSSAVFLAQEEDPERKVAVKVFLPRNGLDGHMQRDFYRRFLHEAEAASKLDHPNILPIYSYGEEDGLPYIVMPYMPGGTLAEYLARRNLLSWLEVQWYVEQIASALDYAHEHGCVHCDVKPANILLDSEGHVLLSDFGIARLSDIEGGETKKSGIVMGTPDYISPEQALGRPLDGRADVYSLAVTVFLLLTKSLPFKAETPIALALQQVHAMPPSMSQRRADIPPELDQVILKAMEKDPAQRFQTAGDFSTAFTAAVLISTVQPSSFRHQRNEPSTDALINDWGPQTEQQAVIGLPILRIKPIKPAFQLDRPRVVLLLATCLLFMGIFGFTLKAVTGGLASPSRHAPGIDLLAERANWPTSKTFFFASNNQTYHIVNKSANEGALALDYAHNVRNFQLSITMSEVSNLHRTSGYYGVILRATPDQSYYYLFEIAPSEHDHYAFLRYDGQWTTIADGTASSLQDGAAAQNNVTIAAQGNSFSCAINGKPVMQHNISDPAKSPFTSGLIGLYVEDQGAEVAFSQLDVDTNPQHNG